MVLWETPHLQVVFMVEDRDQELGEVRLVRRKEKALTRQSKVEQVYLVTIVEFKVESFRCDVPGAFFIVSVSLQIFFEILF
jgi:hypothetical protein